MEFEAAVTSDSRTDWEDGDAAGLGGHAAD